MCASVCYPQCPTYRCGLSIRVKFLRFQANHSLTMLLFDSLVSYMLCAGGCSLIIWFSCTLIVLCTSTALISILTKTLALLSRVCYPRCSEWVHTSGCRKGQACHIIAMLWHQGGFFFATPYLPHCQIKCKVEYKF
ncbi:hypothetical protein CY35_03G034500 [Sphagnum magellanicum]|nr:hypothetical protein CY35_03G034500 [Sphagnum magellanicum]